MKLTKEQIIKVNETAKAHNTSWTSRLNSLMQYSSKGQLVNELIQNADDADATTIEFTLERQSLTVRHNGTPFTLGDLIALLEFDGGAKLSTEYQTGHLGLGFKSVFLVTATPRIQLESGQVLQVERLSELSEVGEIASNPIQTVHDDFKTTFELPFNHSQVEGFSDKKLFSSREEAYDSLKRKLLQLDAQYLLFTGTLSKILVRIDGDIIQVHREPIAVIGNALESPAKGPSLSQCSVRITRRHLGETATVAFCLYSRQPFRRTVMSIAFALDDHDPESVRPVSIPSSMASLFITLPTKEATKLGFAINAKFEPNNAREFLNDAGQGANAAILRELAGLFWDVLQFLVVDETLTMTLLGSLGTQLLQLEQPDDIYSPFSKAFSEELKRARILPCAAGGYCKLADASIATDSRLITLFPEESFRWATVAPKWLHEEICGDSCFTLRAYLTKFRLPVNLESTLDARFSRINDRDIKQWRIQI